MSVPAFQSALADLIASPELCLALRRDPPQVLDRYELTAGERRRLAAVVWQRGMSTSCTLYRVNRITPVYTLLGRTCFLLGDPALIREAENFWRECPTDLQFEREIDAFGAFLKRRIRAGVIDDPWIEEVVDLELAVNALRFLPRRSLLRELQGAASCDMDAPLHLHPLVRIVRFRHDPARLLPLLDRRSPPPYALAEGEFFLLVSTTGEELEINRIDAEPGRLLLAIQAGEAPSLKPEEAALLLREGLVVRSCVTG
jgi:hypothetical protein